MYWKQLVIFYAARILEAAGEKELATKLRAFRVPLIDEGGVMIVKRTAESDDFPPPFGQWVSFARWHTPERPRKDDTVLLPLPASLWDDAAPGCDCECHRLSKAGSAEVRQAARH